MIIMSILLVGGMYMYKTYKRDREVVNEQVSRERIVSAIAEFVQKYDRFPCPAPANLTPDSPDFGKEPAGCTAGGATPTAIVTGIVPVFALNMPFQRAADIYSRKLTYAVTESLVKINGISNNAAIRVTSNNGEVRNAQFVIVNHGADGKGATAVLSTTVGLPCTGTAPDVENCDGDRDFNDFQYAPQNDPYNANHYDDHLSYNLATKETSLWVMAPGANGSRISNKNNANVGIGKTIPDEKLHVSGGVKLDSGTEEVKVTATGKIITGVTGVAGSGEIYSEKQIEAGTTMQGERIRATVFSYDPPPP
ncbi:MAG: prepilin-type cleavage/methylation domain-containing protein [Acinetobacter sp.]|nr:prepilin-type cleavage/methylation domain-containing protein [Acinetobacter sp.]